MLIAQLTDSHVMEEGELLNDRFDLNDYLAAAIDHLTRLTRSPDVVLFSGDLTNTGSEREYRRVKAHLDRLDVPVFITPGNHDHRGRLRHVFSDYTYLQGEKHLQYVIDDFDVRLIALDTTVPGEPHGALCLDRLAWLEAWLAHSSRPTVIFMHHHLFPIGMTDLDSTRLGVGLGRLTEIVKTNSSVKLILSGHAHRPVYGTVGGVPAVIAPSVAHQLCLDLRPAADQMFQMDPPAIALHLWNGSAFCSHLSFIGNYSGPHEYR